MRQNGSPDIAGSGRTQIDVDGQRVCIRIIGNHRRTAGGNRVGEYHIDIVVLGAGLNCGQGQVGVGIGQQQIGGGFGRSGWVALVSAFWD